MHLCELAYILKCTHCHCFVVNTFIIELDSNLTEYPSFLNISEALQDISKYIKHYEGLSYDRELIKQQHQRIRRETHPNKQELHLNFNAFQRYLRFLIRPPYLNMYILTFIKHFFFGREFHLRLKPDVNGFAEDFKIQSEDEAQMVDLSHIYSGVVEGRTFCSTSTVLNATQFLSIINVTKMKLFLSQRWECIHVSRVFSQGASLKAPLQQPMGRSTSSPLTDTPPPTLTTIPSFITKMMWVSDYNVIILYYSDYIIIYFFTEVKLGISPNKIFSYSVFLPFSNKDDKSINHDKCRPIASRTFQYS